MTYLSILMAAWVLAFVVIRIRNTRKTAFAIAQIERIGASVSMFKAEMAKSNTWLIELWASFFFGSTFGAVACALYWALK